MIEKGDIIGAGKDVHGLDVSDSQATNAKNHLDSLPLYNEALAQVDALITWEEWDGSPINGKSKEEVEARLEAVHCWVPGDKVLLGKVGGKVVRVQCFDNTVGDAESARIKTSQQLVAVRDKMRNQIAERVASQAAIALIPEVIQ